MGENNGTVWLLAAFAFFLVIGVIFSSQFNINALAFFGGVS